MRFSLPPRGRAGRRILRPGAALLAILVTAALAAVAVSSSAAAAGPRINLRALVIDDGSVWVKGIADQFTLEGVPFTEVELSDSSRPTITAGFLADGTEAKFNAVILPDDLGGGLPAAELSALTAFQAQFGVRSVAAYQWANPTVGLNYAASPNGFAGDLTGLTATATDAAKSGGFGYLSGDLTIGVGTYGFIATPAGADVMPAGGTFTPFVTVPIPGSSTPGSLVGVYANGGVEKMIITGAMSTSLSQFRQIAHGVVSWVTKGTHFGFNRNYFTFHYDDTFSYVARWDTENNCTPTEDCPASVTTVPPNIRMTAQDVTNVVDWQKANDYRITMAFNGYYSVNDKDGNAWNGRDALTNSLVANKSEFHWLNHGYEHIYQGCEQDFSVVPWVCTTTDGKAPAANGSNIKWLSRTAVSSEISQNIKRGKELGLNFDPAEYLSGEHSGLFRDPQQPVDNPNFGTALSDNAIKYIGADASREEGARVVGSATTVPRHPVAVYYNVSTRQEQVDEYNWIYLSRANGGSGYCEDNPATATCLAAPLDPDTGFADYIVPTDAANDLRFILSNDPRPFYAHVTNLTGPDYLGMQLMSSIISQYRSVFTAQTPLVNLSLTEASTILAQQQAWAKAGMGANPAVTGYVQDGVVTVTSSGSNAAPVTVPAGTKVNGTAFGSAYGGELSGWVNGSTKLTLPSDGPNFTSAENATFAIGKAGTFSVTTAPAATSVTAIGDLPNGITVTDNGNGTATLSGTPAAGTGGSYPLLLTATNALGTTTQAFTLNVSGAPAFTSEASTQASAGTAFTYTVKTSGFPAATISRSGNLPSGVTLTPGTDGTAVLAGKTSSTGTFPLTLTATNSAGTATQAFTLTVTKAPVITSSATATAMVGLAFTKAITTTGSPTPAVTVEGLPAGLTFTANTNGGGTISGRPAAGSGGSHKVTVTANNTGGTTTQTLTITVRQSPAFTSANNTTATRGTAFTFPVTTSGYPAASLNSLGLLPPGVRFVNNNDGTATLSGTPTLRGTYRVLISALSTSGATTQTFTLTVR
ncbi:putative Ig domain-containing protein [Kineosporia babensis]|uniref:Ig domain-containing protein n=1 Tax=Kineosporia babensis TaxID=499548 RepID=A0A9X1SSJ2_9ACTN|nr:putative Ig domain-containing protein [Kineosporia babensis]MCD5310722.1 putative Ig domain-containing protein [Kineosporia babensis]